MVWKAGMTNTKEAPMSTAEFLQSYLESFETQEDGYKDSLWVKAIKVMAIPEAIDVIEESLDSYDSGIRLLFKDGSCLYIGNPRQSAFAGFSYVID